MTMSDIGTLIVRYHLVLIVMVSLSKSSVFPFELVGSFCVRERPFLLAIVAEQLQLHEFDSQQGEN